MIKKLKYTTKILTQGVLVKAVEKLKKQGKKMVMTGGFFDILHPGHVRLLHKAKNLGDILIVALNSDDSTRKNKGSKRPINNQNIRAELLAALEMVDFVTIFDELTPKEIIAKVKPDIWVKGGHYKTEQMPETTVIKSYRGKIKILPLESGFSVSNLVEKIIREKPRKAHQKNSFVR